VILRPYQRDAVDAVYRYLRIRDDNPCVVIPTGGGKTPIIATICKDAVERWDGRVLVLTHVRELLEQTVERISAICSPGALPTVGVYSAGANRRDLGYATTCATIQSIWRKADALGRVDVVLVDEAHMIPTDGDGGEGMYRTFLHELRQANPSLRVVGFTATPWRMKGGLICGPKNSGAILNTVCYEIGVRELTDAGYLSPIRIESGPRKASRIDFGEIRVRAGEFVLGDVEKSYGDDHAVIAHVDDLVERTQDRRSVLIFASGVAHGWRISEAFKQRHNAECAFVSAKTPDAERDETIRRFSAGELRYLCNVGVLTTGFDAPRIDCVALMRPTMSPGLYSQMTGRGLRLSPETGKRDCLVIDYGENALRHGLLDSVRLPPDGGSSDAGEDLPPARECIGKTTGTGCGAILPTACTLCPNCGRVLEEIKPKPKRPGSDGPTWAMVDRVEYHEHSRRDGSGFPTMRVEYTLAGGGPIIREWICIQHPRGGFARRKAEHWWGIRSRNPFPCSTEDAVILANAGELAEPRSILFERPKGEKYDRVLEYELGDRPAFVDLRQAIQARDDALWSDDGSEFDGIPT
jgi:DNA repair protein RadD